ncbi:hypothetical protein V8B55DRAFT_1532631 [Mucor lusitanicus]|uniref:Uncharacterized protein n=2 Tax=Mucor circinelloides f. lusitanicus TaxID=29924 RepID=A0A162MUG4_MUCCL|nr:hypothetical protein FB192DRAFT_1448127 [Mucor lusitanicus]OAD00033.1 hypothetical protein MUCCIDRAFT_113481 [Mucor lusitanicus CBS 277.49]
MIPRLPPLILALVGGASIYGIKFMLDRFEPKAIGPPGSTEHIERVLRYRQNVKRAAIASAVSGAIYGVYWMYDARQHRASPSVISNTNEGFYQDQYSERDKRLQREYAKRQIAEREKEQFAKQHLEQEVTAMEDALKKNK